MANNLAQMIATVQRTTGREPQPLVGASTTILGDTLYVFGGRAISKQTPVLTNDLYALDLKTRVWTKIQATGDIPAPRYFHSTNALGETKLVCFGGMAPPQNPSSPGRQSARTPMTEVIMMNDIHIFDIETNIWTYIPCEYRPEGRYAHCATVLPSWGVYTSGMPPNRSDAAENGELAEDGEGGAELVIVGGQNTSDTYIEEVNVFNFRSLTWSEPTPLGKSCGVYKSVVLSLPLGVRADDIGCKKKGMEGSYDNQNGTAHKRGQPSVSGGQGIPSTEKDPRPSMLIYSNYNFLDVRLELQIRNPDGTLTEKTMNNDYSPPGLRFPNGGIHANHFVVSGTYLTSSVQEYALWALNLATLEWTKIDAGSTFTTGSWNRGMLWKRRNAFVVLGRKDRSLVDDYNQRKINFSHLCIVQLDSFGLFTPPPQPPPYTVPSSLSPRGQALGRLVFSNPSFADMHIISLQGERIPISSRIFSARWGAYFDSLMPSPPLSPTRRPRTLFLPHTHATILALVHYIYTYDLAPNTAIPTLCSLLQIARPYRVPGLLGKVTERLHELFDARNAAAVFNAAAMAAGPGADGKIPGERDYGEVLGVQKRGLRGLAEGRLAARERGRSQGVNGSRREV